MRELSSPANGQNNYEVNLLKNRNDELESLLEDERKARQRAERDCNELDQENQMLQDQMEDGGPGGSQLARKKEQEIAKLRSQLELISNDNEEAIAVVSKKFNVQLLQMQEEMEVVRKTKSRVEKEKTQLACECDELATELENSKRAKQSADKTISTLEGDVSEFKSQVSVLEDRSRDSENAKTKLAQEKVNLKRQLEESEQKLSSANTAQKALEERIHDISSAMDVETKAKQEAQGKLNSILADHGSLEDMLDQEQMDRAQLQDKLLKVNSEASLWKGKYEREAMPQVEELEENKRKLVVKIQQLEESLQSAQSKASSLEKVKSKLTGEVDDLSASLDDVQALLGNVESKLRKSEAASAEWKSKFDTSESDNAACNEQLKALTAQVVKWKKQNEETAILLANSQREGKGVQEELRSTSQQLGDSQKSAAELEKSKRRAEAERDENYGAFEDAENAFESEKAKVVSALGELSNAKQNSEKRLAEKEEELDGVKKNLQRQLETVQASLEAEVKAKSEQIRLKRKVETELNEVEGLLENAERLSQELSKTNKKNEQLLKEMQAVVDEERAARSVAETNAERAGRKAKELAAQLETAKNDTEQAERARKAAQNESIENAERAKDLQNQFNSLTAEKRRIEGDLLSVQSDLKDLETELNAAEDRANKAANENMRLASDLASAERAAATADKAKMEAERQVVDLQGRLEELEALGGRYMKNQIRKLEAKVRDVEGELSNEMKKNSELAKNYAKADKRAKELAVQLDDESKSLSVVQDQILTLNGKVKKLRESLGDAEAISAASQAKLRKAQAEVDDAEERAQRAERALMGRARGKAGRS